MPLVQQCWVTTLASTPVLKCIDPAVPPLNDHQNLGSSLRYLGLDLMDWKETLCMLFHSSEISTATVAQLGHWALPADKRNQDCPAAPQAEPGVLSSAWGEISLQPFRGEAWIPFRFTTLCGNNGEKNQLQKIALFRIMGTQTSISTECSTQPWDSQSKGGQDSEEKTWA